jgi:hypothetical protein
MKQEQPRVSQRLEFCLSSWLVFLVVAYMVFANAGMFDHEFGDDAAPYVGFAIVVAVVGGLLWRIAALFARDGKQGPFWGASGPMPRLRPRVLGALLMLACSPMAGQEQIPIDQVPMYGGMDRSQFPDLKAGDEKFIEDVSRHFGSREKAARAWIEQGYRFYQQDRLDMAMRRFNQAWLLDPNNAEVYAGFAAVLHDQGKNCPAMKMIEEALSRNPPTYQGIYPDAGRIIALCAVSDSTLSADAKAALLERSEVLFRKGEEVERDKAYLYGTWATAYYWREQYAEAWTMVGKQRQLGGQPSPQFIKLLTEKMPGPAR